MTTRKLASIQKIEEIKPIEGADLVVHYRVLGWWVVGRKDEFNVGDKVVYIEIDSILPEKTEFEFLRPKKFRIKTQKIRGVISQGIIFSMDILPNNNYSIGDDVSDIIGVKKYEPNDMIEQEALSKVKTPDNKFVAPIKNILFRYCPSVARFIFRKSKKESFAWPKDVPHTDETRVQILQDLITEHKGNIFYTTEKVDGSSITIYYINKKFGICSRNINYGDGKRFSNNFTDTVLKYKLDEILPSYCKERNLNLAIQGELLGPKIQGNKYELTDYQILFFSVFDVDKKCYLNYTEAVEIIHELGMTFVPLVNPYYEMTDDIDELIEKSIGKSLVNPKIQREGLVFRLLNPVEGQHVSFKAINPKFLLKFEE